MPKLAGRAGVQAVGSTSGRSLLRQSQSEIARSFVVRSFACFIYFCLVVCVKTFSYLHNIILTLTWTLKREKWTVKIEDF